jgi:hypothetical protein
VVGELNDTSHQPLHAQERGSMSERKRPWHKEEKKKPQNKEKPKDRKVGRK